MTALAGSVSIKNRLLLTLLAPLGLIMLVLGFGGAWLIGKAVENSSDRVLSGSLQAIAETLAVQEGNLTMDLPPSALGMLENADRDNVYYNVTYHGKLITGYAGVGNPLTRIERDRLSLWRIPWCSYPDRIRAEAGSTTRRPVLVQVAETTKNRNTLARRMLAWLVSAETFLLLAIAVLVYFAVDWGLRPLTALREEIQDRNDQADLDFTPLPLAAVPQEALALVSAFNAFSTMWIRHSTP